MLGICADTTFVGVMDSYEGLKQTNVHACKIA